MDDKKVAQLGYSDVLLRDIEECSRAFGLDEEYRLAVLRLKNDVLDVRDGPQCRTLVEEFISGPWRASIERELDSWKRVNVFDADDLSIVQNETEKIESAHMLMLCNFIKQLLMSSGCIRNFAGSD